MNTQAQLTIRDLHASVEGQEILKGLSFKAKSGEVHAIMGPNGSGKSTLANVVMGNPKYAVTSGGMKIDEADILEMDVNERAHAGLFLAFQYPVEIPGVSVAKFLKRAIEAKNKAAANGQKFSAGQFIKELRENVAFLEMDSNFVNRYLNDGFSGGEKKRMEVLQMLMLKPKFAILDEPDSGLDIDAIQIVSRGVNKIREAGSGAIVITHYQRILNYVNPDYVHILYQGRIVTSGGRELVDLLEQKGYDWVREKYGHAA